MARGRTSDPPRRAVWPRPNALPTAGTISASVLFICLLTLGSASAQTSTGGCLAKIDGQAPTKLTRSDPLIVGPHAVVAITGQVPPKAASSHSKKIKTTTAVEVTTGVRGVTVKTIKTTGPSWGGHLNIDPYLRFGVGLYRVEVVATGTGGWTCRATAYVRLKGSPLSKPIGRAAVVLLGMGVVGALVSTKANSFKKPKGTWDKATDVFADAACLIVAVMIFYSFVAFPGVLGATAAGSTGQHLERRWGHGRTGLGFFSGLLAGIGATILAQQYAVWPITTTTGIGLPLALAILVAVRAHIGQPYKVQPKAT
jgi:hypothetical protein